VGEREKGGEALSPFPTPPPNTTTTYERDVEINLERLKKWGALKRPTLLNAQDRFQLPFHM